MDKSVSFNVDDIMADIRKKIKEENLSAAVLSFDDIPLNGPEVLLKGGYDTHALQCSTEYVSCKNQLNYNTPIQGNPLKCFIKKVIRKLVQFYVVPIVEQQNSLNQNYSNALLQVNGFIQKAAANDSVVLSMRIEELELRQLYNKKEIEELSEQVRFLKKELEALRKTGGQK